MKKYFSIILMLVFFILVGCNQEIPDKEVDPQYELYEYAFENGFFGTYEEWLNSIKDNNESSTNQDKRIELAVNNGYIVWRYLGEVEYVNLINLNDLSLINETKEIEFRLNDDILQYKSLNDGTWIDLIKVRTEELYYTVTFNVDGGSLIPNQVVKFGEKIVMPENPTKEGYEFAGWAYGETNWNFIYDKVMKDVELVAKWKKVEPVSVKVYGDISCFVGYRFKLFANITPSNALQEVIWVSYDESIATVDKTGLVTAKKSGVVIIAAICKENPDIFYEHLVYIESTEETYYPFNMGGYEIVIMGPNDILADVDPFLDSYTGADKIYKQKAWKEVETDFNCKIVVKPFTPSAVWNSQRFYWLVYNAANNISECDLAIVSSSWIPDCAQASAAVNVKPYYDQYGLKQMESHLKDAGTYNDKLYIASTGVSPSATHVDLGLYYNLAWMEKLGVKDPAQMFNDGEWTYTGFKNWVLDTQSKLNEGEFVFGGHPYYYYYGMTNAAGVKIADTTLVQTNIASQRSKEACELIYSLVEAGCCDKVVSWAEIDGGFIDQTTLMTTGYLWFAKSETRWKADMFGDDTRYGYVPFPYPDDVAKEDTRIGVSWLPVLMYVAGRNYPVGITTKDVYQVVNEMFLNTIRYQKYDPKFDAEVTKRVQLRLLIDNPASIEAIMYYDASKVFYDPAHAIYSSASASVLKNPSINVMYNGENFDLEFNSVYDSFDTLFKKIYEKKDL